MISRTFPGKYVNTYKKKKKPYIEMMATPAVGAHLNLTMMIGQIMLAKTRCWLLVVEAPENLPYEKLSKFVGT